MTDDIILVDGLVKIFGSLTAVNNVSLHVKTGEVFAFLGPNGAGKTTTIKMLTTLLPPTSGSIIMNSLNPTTEQQKVRESFGIVFQDHSVDDDLTALENMMFHGELYNVPKDICEKRIEYLLNLVDLWDRRNDLVKTFSGGMKRRLEIARGLIHHPKILFLDEPTLGLDPQTRNHIWEHIMKLNKAEGMTIFFTTHYMGEAEKYADTISIIDHGKIITSGNLKDLKKITKKKNLEDAFLSLTGHAIREEQSSNVDRLRTQARAWGRK